MSHWALDDIYHLGDDPGPSVEELARAVEAGRCCSECGTEFVKPHDKKVACAFCWARLTLNEQQDIGKAVHDEKNRAAHRNEARKRKQQRGRGAGTGASEGA